MDSRGIGKRIIGVAMVLCLLAGTVSFNTFSVQAAVTAESIKEKEGQISNAK